MPRPIGLSNGSNYCYFITSIQLIADIPDVQHKITQLKLNQEELKKQIGQDLYNFDKKYSNSYFYKYYNNPNNPQFPYEGIIKEDDHLPTQNLVANEIAITELPNSIKIVDEKVVRDKDSKKDQKKEEKKLSWLEYIKELFNKACNKAWSLAEDIFSFVKSFILTKILEPIESFIDSLLEEDEDNQNDKEIRKKSRQLHHSSQEERDNAKLIIEKIKKYYLIELFDKLFEENKKENQQQEPAEWIALKKLILFENQSNEINWISQQDLNIEQFFYLLELNDISCLDSWQKRTIYKNDLEKLDNPIVIQGSAQPVFLLGNFTTEELDALKHIIHQNSENISKSTSELYGKILSLQHHELTDKRKALFTASDVKLLDFIETKDENLFLKMLHNRRARDPDNIEGVLCINLIEKEGHSVLPDNLFESSELEEVSDYRLPGDDELRTVHQENKFIYQTVDNTSVLSIKIKNQPSEKVNIEPPLILEAPVLGTEIRKKYYLHSVGIKHGGQNGGHWTSYRSALNQDGGLSWYHLNDESSRLVENFTISKGAAQHLIYVDLKPDVSQDKISAYEAALQEEKKLRFTGFLPGLKALVASYNHKKEKAQNEKKSVQTLIFSPPFLDAPNSEDISNSKLKKEKSPNIK